MSLLRFDSWLTKWVVVLVGLIRRSVTIGCLVDC